MRAVLFIVAVTRACRLVASGVVLRLGVAETCEIVHFAVPVFCALRACCCRFAMFVVLAGLWYFRRWARLIFVLALALSVVDSAFWPYRGLSLPPSFVLAIGWCVVLLNGAIVAMSFLPPVRDVFATSDLTNR